MDSINKQVVESDSRKRMLEFIGIVVISTLLIIISRLETRLFELSESLSQSEEFISTIIYFGIINFDIILILLLSFLVFRNLAKLILERKRGVFGSRLRSKLVVSLVLFAIAPTILIFFISSQFIITSFDKWFSERVKSTVEQAKEATDLVYEQTQIRLETLIKLAQQKINLVVPTDYTSAHKSRIEFNDLKQFTEDYSLNSLIVFDASGEVIWPDTNGNPVTGNNLDFIFSSLERFYQDPSLGVFSNVFGESETDVIRGIGPIMDATGRFVIGGIFIQEEFETNIVGSIRAILRATSRQAAALWALTFSRASSKTMTVPIMILFSSKILLASASNVTSLPSGTKSICP